MAIRGNRYNDPALGTAFENIASLFAPPSAQDAAAYADAGLKNQRKAEIAQLFSNPNDPQFDRRNIVAGNYAPTQSFYAQDQNNATTRRGQDITASTSLANNKNTVRGSAIGQLFGPLSQGQVRPEVPASVASTIGLPSIDGATGADKPLSETEWQAQQDQRLLGSGALTDQNMVDNIMGTNTPVKALGGDGKPVYMSPGEAERTGAGVAYPPQSGGLTVTTNADGTTTVTQGKSLTESQSKDAYYLNNGLSSLPTLDKFGSALTSLPSALASGVDVGGVNVGNYAKSPEYQQAEQAGRVFLNAILRKESGAAITPQEDTSYGSTYLPRPGDGPDVLAQKKLARERALQGIQLGLPAATILQMEKAGIIPPKGATVDPPATTLPDGVTEDDIQFTMQTHGLTRDQVLQQLGAANAP